VVLESQDLTEVLGVEKDYRLVLVDTPGLDWSAESKLDPEAVREDIMKWSNRWYVLELFRG
jgi:flagellar biosynthesis GTPase FlhF